MNILKKLKIFIIIILLLLYIIPTNTYAMQASNNVTPIRAAVFISTYDDIFVNEVKKDLEEIQSESKNNIKFTFFNANGNQGTQNESIIKALNQDFNLFIIRLVNENINDLHNIFIKIEQSNTPLILLYEKSPAIVNLLKPYHKAVIINTDLEQSGRLEGKILADYWNANKQVLDKNHDNIMQYIMLRGPSDSNNSIIRTKYSVQTINEAGIKTQELSSVSCNFLVECARTAMESMFLKYGNNIEAIISNNDAMAIGAINALQKYGYNSGDKAKYIPVVGIDALPEGKKLINQGAMLGTVSESPKEHANAIYSIGKNLVYGEPPLSNTNYSFDETGISIELPYSEYVK